MKTLNQSYFRKVDFADSASTYNEENWLTWREHYSHMTTWAGGPESDQNFWLLLSLNQYHFLYRNGQL